MLSRLRRSIAFDSERTWTIVAVLAGIAIGLLGSARTFQLLLGLGTVVGIVVVARPWVRATPLQRALTAVVVLFAVAFTFFYVDSVTRFGTVVLRGANTHTAFAMEMVDEPLSAIGRPPDNDYYFVFLTAFYKLGPIGRIGPVLVNFLAFCYLVVVTYRLANDVFGPPHARNAAILLVVFPTSYFHVYATRPDVLSIALVMGILYSLTRLRSLVQWRLGVRIVALLSLVLLLRVQLAVLLALTVFLTLVLRQVLGSVTAERVVRSAMLSVGSAVAFVSLAYWTDVWGFRSSSPASAIERVLTYRIPTDASVGLSEVVYGAPIPVRLVLGFVPLVVTPFPPWETITESLSMAFYTTEGLAFFALTPFALVGVLETVRDANKDALPLVIYAGTMASVLALVYAGFALKFRFLLVPPLLIFASVGLSYRAGYRRPLLLWYATYPALAVVYVLLNGGI